MDLRHAVQVTGVRRLSALLNGLPPDSALNRAGSAWTTQDEIAALAVERQEHYWSIWLAMNAKEPKKLPPPIAVTHPDRPEPEPEPKQRKQPTRDPAQIARVFGGR
jgi:hypothetical protein